jgi:prepilin-type N-terminal cleavage/methylation domain-containing protein
MKKNNYGFTIVELLIVIVVIAILAAISIVAYNGIQQRSRNTQTINAVASWVKALKLYEADNGAMPNNSGCLGSVAGYGYGPDGTDVSGYQCRQDNPSYGISVNSSFNTALASYLQNSLPQPYTKAAYLHTSTYWYRGAYYYNTSPGRIDFVLEGKGTTCPTIGGLTLYNSQNSSTTDTVFCSIRFAS